MKKKLMSVMLVIAMVISMVPTAFAAEVDADDVKAKVEEYYNWAVANPEAAYDEAVDLVEWVEANPEEAYANVAKAYADAYAKVKAAGYVAQAQNATAELAAELEAIVTSALPEGIPAEYLEELEKEVAAAKAVLKEVAAALENGDLATIEGAKNVAWELIPELEECLDHVVHALLLAAEDAEEYVNAEVIPALEAKAAELEEKWETEWRPALEETIEELIAEAKAAAEAALGEAYDALVEALTEAAKEYAPEVADAIYDYLYNNPDKVIAFVKEYSGDVAAFVAENQEEILAVLGYLAATYGEDVVNFVMENDQEILETMVEWYAVHGDNFEALVLVYLEELGVIDAAEDLYAKVEEMLGEAAGDIEAAIEEIIAEVEAAIAELEAALEDLKAELEDLKAELENAAEDAKAEIEKAIAEIEKAIEEIEAAIEALKEKAEELYEIAEDIYNAAQDVIDAIAMAGENFDAAVAALQQALADLAEAIGAAEEFIAELNDTIAEAIEWASDAIAALGELAEEIAAGAVEVMETVEEIIAGVQDAIEEAAAEIEEAYEAFKQAVYDATHETVYGCTIDTYVALGGNAVAAEAGYVDAVAAYVDAANVIELSEMTGLETAAAYIEANAETIAAADFITYQMEATALIDILLGEADWTAYLNDDAIAFAEEIEAALIAELAKELDAEALESAAPMAEKVAYCAVSYAVETVKALETINAINAEAPVLVIGMYNPLAGLTATVGGEEIAIGEMVEYAMQATDLYYVIYAVATGNVDFVHACGTDIVGYDKALDVDAIAEDIALIMAADVSKYEELLAAANRITALVEELLNSMLTSEEGQADIFEAVKEVLTVESHKWNDGVVTAPTCTEAGYTTYTCVLCGETSVEAGDPATGHTWGDWQQNETEHWKECACGEIAEKGAHVNADSDKLCDVCGYGMKSDDDEDDKDDDGNDRPSSSSSKKPAKVENPFTDVNKGDYFYDAVLWAVEEGITTGVTDTLFAPYGQCTRAQMVTFLWRAMGSPEPETKTCAFVDVSADAYYYDAVLWGVENDVIKGTSETTFSPNETVTRCQTVTFLWRNEGAPEATASCAFTDVAEGAYYYDAVLWAVEEEVTNGTSATTFSPEAPCLRGQIVTLMYRHMAD